jgi:imidazolonepropionase-like amidohydrolase
MTVAFTGAKLIDGNGAAPLENATVIVDGTKVVEISDKCKFDSSVQVFDVAGKTLMPGLIDTHLHISAFFQWLISVQHRSLGYLFVLAIRHMRQLIESGVTSARDMGGLEAGICEAQAEGLIVGPRMQTAIVIIQPTNGLTDLRSGLNRTITPQGRYEILPGLPEPWADGPDAVRAKVREALRLGADSIKLANNATPWGNPKVRPDRPLFTRAELEAAVDEAHRAGVPVTCHVVGWDSTESTLDAIRAGVDLIDHGNLLDDECIEEMVKRGTWYCPMFSVLDYHRSRNPNQSVRAFAERTYQQTAASFQKAVKAGVRICMGTDQGYETGVQGFEMRNMVANGYTPMQTIVASTKLAAEAMRVDRLVGTLEVGKEADLLVLEGDPSRDIGIFSDPIHLRLVMQAGKPLAGPMAREFPYQPAENLDFMSAMLTGQLKKRSW